ncbi:MAG: DUF4230 domain-containing protein [Anaerolineales bacterium]
MERMRPWLPALIGVAILIMVAIPCYLVFTTFGAVSDLTNAGVDQVRQMADSVSTQVANVLHPTPTIIPDPITIIHSVRSLARLETIQYSVEKVIVAESGQGPFGFLFGDRLLFIAHGMVLAGVDVEKLTPADLRVEGGVLYVTLPKAEVFIAALDNERSYIYDRDQGIFPRGNETLETEARRAAEQEILNAALEDGILEQAQINAESYLLRLFLSLGFPDVIFDTGN